MSAKIMTRITTPFGKQTTAAEVAAGIKLPGKSIIVTGAASGIGVETARALASTGASITLAVRNTVAAAPVAADITATTGNPKISIAQLDLADRKSIAAFVAAWRGSLHILVNNAGVMATPETRTAEGYEMQFATNHLGHFALTLGLHDALAADGAARVVVVASKAHNRSPVVFEDIHFHHRPYEPISAYGQSKTANILFAVEASKRWVKDGVTANSLMPGAIKTNLQRHVGRMVTPPDQQKTVAQGAATSVLLAVSPLLAGIGGRYFDDCNEALPAVEGQSGGVMPYALDPKNAERLWEESMRMMGVM
jgi:NAD(P)-dependent dehydrogenase (short-subunit alcohol dehydrogenase family)